jgi:hypothetical protein
MRAAGLSNTSNTRNTNILARYALIRKNAAITAATTPQRNTQEFRQRYVSDAQPIRAENTHHSQQNTRRG